MIKSAAFLVSVAALGFSALPIASPVLTRGEPCGAAVTDIALCLAPSEQPDVVQLSIENRGTTDAVLDLGIALANGARQYPTAVRLTLTDSRGEVHRAELAEPGAVAGRLDPMILPLPAGASLRLPLALSKYALYDVGGKLSGIGLVAGERYTVFAYLTGEGVRAANTNLDMKGLALLPYWIGRATSNTIAIRAASAR